MKFISSSSRNKTKKDPFWNLFCTSHTLWKMPLSFECFFLLHHVHLNSFNNQSASPNLVCWTFYLSARTQLSLSSLFWPANVIECCALTTKVIICSQVRAISLVPIASQPDRASLCTLQLYLFYLRARRSWENYLHIFAETFRKVTKGYSFVCSELNGKGSIG